MEVTMNETYVEHACADCGGNTREELVCWSMATPICPICWLAENSDQ